MTYKEQLKDPRWKLKRVEILARDRCTCFMCGYIGSRLNIHHSKYIGGLMAWEYNNELLYTLCYDCHNKTHRFDLISKSVESKLIKNIISNG